MKLRRPFPLPGMIIALGGCAVILFAGVDPAICIGMLILWVSTLWISRPETAPVERRERGMQISRDTMAKLIQHSGLPMLLLDRNRILVANAAACEALGEHIIGQDARVPLRQPAAVELLDSPAGGSASIPGLTGARSIWRMSRFPIDERYWIIELLNKTAEADISRAHTDFVANASHELRTPLAAILGYVETLQDMNGEADGETRHRFLSIIDREARRMQQLVIDLLSISRVEADRFRRPTAEVDLREIVSTTIAQLRDSEAARAKDIVADLGDAPLPILGDAAQLGQLAHNIISNAMKYGHADTPVTVELVRDGKRARLSVTDRGEGIAPDHLPRLTERFYRVDEARSRSVGGTGLGLAIVKHIGERHQGQLDIESELGKGTRVSLAFPLSEKA